MSEPNRHFLYKTSKMAYKCPSCEQLFDSEEGRQRHYFQEHCPNSRKRAHFLQYWKKKVSWIDDVTLTAMTELFSNEVKKRAQTT